MFKWLERLVFGASAGDDYFQMPNLIDAHRPRKSFLEEHRESEVRFQAMLDIYCPERVRQRKKEQLEEELEDAEWMLKYERKLTKLEEQIAEEIDRADRVGRSPERLRKLDRYLAHLHPGVSDRVK